MNKLIRPILFSFFVILTTNVFSIERDSLRVKKERIFEVFETFGLNSTYSDISPVFFNTELVFCSNREWNKNTYGMSDWSETNHYNIFRSSVNFTTVDSVAFEKVKIFNHFLVSHLNVGPITFDKAFKNAVYVENEYVGKNKRNGDNNLNVQLYSLIIEDGKLKDKEKLIFCNSKYNYSHPTLSDDGKLLVFSSDMPCKHEGFNLFYSTKEEGEWSNPKPLEGINSDANEIFPMIEGKDLYFSSNGYDTQGGYDLFVAHKVDSSNDISDQWSNHFNLGGNINSEQDDFGIVFNVDGSTGYFVSDRNDTILDQINDDDIFSFEMIEKAIFNNEFQNLSGKFEYFKLKDAPSNLEVMLLDDEGNVFAVTSTDDNGHFNFDYIPAGKKYTIKLNAEGDVVLTLFQEDDNTMLLSNENGEFIFRKLATDYVGTLSLIDEGDINLDIGFYDFRGQIEFQKLIGDQSSKKMMVYLVDEDGNIIMQTETDEFGNFIFEKLPYGSNYLVRVDENSDLLLKIYNNVDHLMATLTNSPSGIFNYRLLDYEKTTNLSLFNDELDNLFFSEERMLITGLFKLKDGVNEKIRFEVLDMDGNLLLVSETDKFGRFKLEDLPLLEDLIFKIDEGSVYYDQDLLIEILTRDNRVLVTLDKGEYGMFEFKRLVSSKYHLTSMEELQDEIEMAKEERKLRIENYVVYYPSNVFKIGDEYIPHLDTLYMTLDEYPDAKIQIHSHASSTASASYNMKLSEKRMNALVSYFKARGVASSRMNYKAYGESKLLNQCGNDNECEDEMHQINRRTELKIILKN